MCTRNTRLNGTIASMLAYVMLTFQVGCPEIISLPPINHPPTADAGADQNVGAGQRVTLNGLSSTDLDDDPLTSVWEQRSGPGPNPTLRNSNSAQPSFVPTLGGVYEFVLTVTDDRGGSDIATVFVFVNDDDDPPCPRADAGTDQAVNEGAVVMLSGVNSADPGGGALTFDWFQLTGPQVSLSGVFTAEPAFAAPQVDGANVELEFELEVTNEQGCSDTDTVFVTVRDRPDDRCNGVVCPDDGRHCNGVEICEDGSCFSSGDPCRTGETCDEATDTCVPDCPVDDCDDDDACTEDACDDGECDHEPVECDDGEFCDPDSGECVVCLMDGDCDDDMLCDTASDECVECFADADCDNGDFCDGTETCDSDTRECVSGEDPCEAGTVCCEEFEDCLTPEVGEVAKLLASDAGANNEFGYSVSASGDCAVVGEWSQDQGGTDAGAAYVFCRNEGGPGNWGEVAVLTASDAAAGAEFGFSVSFSDDTVLVGARFDDTVGPESGYAYIFQRDEGGPDNWGEVIRLVGSDAEAVDSFGNSVSISGDTAVVGALGDDDAGTNAGAAYVFRRDKGGSNNWGEVAKLTASDGATIDQFGISVSIGGDIVIVGANGNDDAGSASGSAYVFGRDEGGPENWGEVKKLTASNAAANDRFGQSVSASGDTAIVGAWDNGPSGSAYIFQRDEGGVDGWGEVKILTASDAAPGDWFGFSVSISGDTALIAARFDDGVATDTGSAYVFRRDEGGLDNWGEMTQLTASDAAGGDQFGHSVSLDGDIAITGAYRHDDVGNNSGSAYVFSMSSTDCD
jgi:FG-GAP repeat/K319L-like, PKD domain